MTPNAPKVTKRAQVAGGRRLNDQMASANPSTQLRRDMGPRPRLVSRRVRRNRILWLLALLLIALFILSRLGGKDGGLPTHPAGPTAPATPGSPLATEASETSPAPPDEVAVLSIDRP